MEALDRKIVAEFPGSVVRKDLVKAVKGNAVVPTYVLEYLLGQYCATADEETIATANGERTFLATKGPLRDGQGKVIGLFGISRDISQQKKVEAVAAFSAVAGMESTT